LQKVTDVDTAISSTTGFEIWMLGYDKAIIVDAISIRGDDLDIAPLLNTHSIPLATTIKLGYTI